jgi:hypothetical protein
VDRQPREGDRRAKELRERATATRLRELWFLDEDGAVKAVNALLRDGHALPQLGEA